LGDRLTTCPSKKTSVTKTQRMGLDKECREVGSQELEGQGQRYRDDWRWVLESAKTVRGL